MPRSSAPSRPATPSPLTRRVAAAVLVLVTLLLLVGWSSAARAGSLTTLAASDGATATKVELGPGQAVVLGVVEGLTEFLPVSSTGHLTVVQRLMKVGDTEGITDAKQAQDIKEATDAYAIVIQAGAILAVVALYRRRLVSVANGVVGRDEDGRRVFLALVVAFVPAAAVAFVFEKKIKEQLFGPWPVVAAWAIGGLLLLGLSQRGFFDRGERGRLLEAITLRDAAVVGAAQCLALWPGTSRSLVTIIAAVALGFTMASAVEFSFLLGLVTLSAATAYDGLKHGGQIVAEFGILSPAIGFVTAFIAALLAIRWMVTYLQRHSLAVFGWYRLGIAAVTVGLIGTGAIKT